MNSRSNKHDPQGGFESLSPKVIVAKTAGFCYGVSRAVSICEKAAEEYSNCVTLGAIIHNCHVTENLQKKGVTWVNDISEIPDGATVIIRAHGAGQKELQELEEKGVKIVDATCPDVKKIHDIARAESIEERHIIIIGERKHPEVIAIAGWSKTFDIFETAEELNAWLETGNNAQKPISVVFQTTNTVKVYNSCNEILKKVCTNLKTFDTICGATYQRQQEAAELSRTADLMVIVGDKSSANSLRLADICREHCARVFFVQSAMEIEHGDIPEEGVIGITAGASVPYGIIKEVATKMSNDAVLEEIEREEDAAVAVEDDSEDLSASQESFEEMLDKSIKTLHTGEKVSGIVTSITATEVSVDLGTKQSGYIPISEFVDDEHTDINEIIKIGDTIEAFVMRVNDVEGMIMLSKKRLDAIKNWDIIEAARENKTTVEGLVVEENKGGIVVNIKGIRVFVPASQTGLPKDSPMSEMLKKTVKLRIREANPSRRRVVGSIRDVQADERREKAESVWADIEVGKRYDGVVKSMTSYGVFVDIGGVDGMIHISEISWIRVKQPSDVMSVGDKISVYILSFDKEARKISLGYKKAEDNPWIKFTSEHKVGDVVNVKVVKMMPFGAFAEVFPGVDGLIHISQIADHRIGLPSEVLSTGQLVDVKITEIDNDRKKVSLSIRALIEPDSEPEEVETEEEEPAAQEATVDEPTVDSEVEAEPDAVEPEPEVAEEPAAKEVEIEAETETEVEAEAETETESEEE